MTTQAEEQLEQASAPKSSIIKVKVNEDVLTNMDRWCSDHSIIVDRSIFWRDPSGANNSRQDVIYRFTSSLDAVAFKLTFSEFL